jgi:hypothetical protein
MTQKVYRQEVGTCRLSPLLLVLIQVHFHRLDVPIEKSHDAGVFNLRKFASHSGPPPRPRSVRASSIAFDAQQPVPFPMFPISTIPTYGMTSTYSTTCTSPAELCRTARRNRPICRRTQRETILRQLLKNLIFLVETAGFEPATPCLQSRYPPYVCVCPCDIAPILLGSPRPTRCPCAPL